MKAVRPGEGVAENLFVVAVEEVEHARRLDAATTRKPPPTSTTACARVEKKPPLGPNAGSASSVFHALQRANSSNTRADQVSERAVCRGRRSKRIAHAKRRRRLRRLSTRESPCRERCRSPTHVQARMALPGPAQLESAARAFETLSVR